MIGTFLHNALCDVRQAGRSLRRAPLFSAIVVVTLAIGIGANTAMFSVIDNLLIKPLPYPAAERLMLVGVRTPTYGSNNYGITSEEYFAIQDSVPGLDALGIYDYGGGTLTGDGGNPEEPTSFSIDPGFQEMLDLQVILGRRFSEEDCQPGANRTVMLGEEIWQRRYAGSDDIIGKIVQLDGNATEVIGIVPDSFRFPNETGSFQVFRPREMARDIQWYSLGLVARLAEGVNEEQAEAQLTALSEARQQADSENERSFYLQPLADNVVGGLRPALIQLWVAVGFVMLLACMNAANLLLARSAARGHEIAVCSALGASRYRVIQRVLCESLVLSLVAGALGLLLAQWGIEGIAALGLTDLPRGDQIGLDGRMFLFTLVVAVVTGLLYGLLPAWQAGRADLVGVIKEGGGRTSLGVRGQRLRWTLTVGEVAVSCVLLIGAGLMLRSSMEIAGTDPGFETENAFGMTMWADQPRGTEETWSVQFYDDALERIRSIPGVTSAGLVSNMPWQTMFDSSVKLDIENHPAFDGGEQLTVKWRTVSENYLADMGVSLEEGRHLTVQDDADSTRVAVISRSMARRFWPEGGAVGQTIRVGSRKVPVEVVGIVGDVHETMLTDEAEALVWAPFRQNPDIATTILVRGEVKPEALTLPVQEAIWTINPTQGIWATRTLEELRRTGLARERLYTQLLSIFAGIAVLLAAVGIYGIISYSVTQRTREIGIRMALGAMKGEILWRVLARGMRLSATGLVLGLPVAFLLTRFLEQVLFDVTALDPWTYAGVTVMMLAIALVACYVPAWRATRVEPMTCLRSD